MIKLNNKEVVFGEFPNGELKLEVIQINNNIKGRELITFKYEDDKDLVKLMILKGYLDDKGVSSGLYIRYMPYSRMDREVGSQAFVLKYIMNFINSLNFTKVYIEEPHSNVTLDLINNSEPIYPTIDRLHDVLIDTDFNKDTDYLFLPDAGALKRYESLTDFKYLYANKVRNKETGRIEKLDVVGDVDKNTKGKKVLILDDLISYGGTALRGAEKLKELGFEEIYLFIAHSEYALLDGKVLKDGSPIKRVYTTDSILDKEVEKKFTDKRLVIL